MAREELKWQNIDADDLPAEVKKSFDAMVEVLRAAHLLDRLIEGEPLHRLVVEVRHVRADVPPR
jgi:hypothetical protein